MSLARPGRFRWDYEQPYQRVVVANGKQLWLYEADLEQVTVRSLAAGGFRRMVLFNGHGGNVTPAKQALAVPAVAGSSAANS